ncbi:hypothetical protein NLG97_g7761 [Lecanicillium saksenae]|uniref:Uncharacterized protein n=1 Tax=Lecanicillium saksenae TaxID=468837 RepID=A0ACC1QKZ3_9HYPO|nr:hypothetical protein NLG97_g7761 [Lecanicillium saksenae]
MADDSLFARQYIDYVYVPGFLLIIGTAIVKASWVIYAIPVALLFGAYNFWNFQIKKVLKPDVFQEFELQEKTVISTM